MKKYALAVLCLALFLIPATASAHRTFTDESLANNSSYVDNIHLFKLSEWIKVNFTSDKPVDIYIMTVTDYGSGSGSKYPTNFTAMYQVLNTTSTYFTWTIPDNTGYVIVVDNQVNNINGSANPTGPVTYTYIRTDSDDHLGAVVEAISMFCLGVVAVIVIIFVVVLVIVLLVRRRSKPVQAPPGAANVAYGTPQQAYQPMPGQYPQQYPQQPGQYMPPPPPPGAPGVPPPPGQ